MMEWLANLSVRWVLVAVGLLLLLRAILRHGCGDRSAARTIREFLDSATVAVVIVFLIVRPHLFQAYYIPSESMHPTLLEADRVLVNKTIYRFARPGRGDIVVFRPPEDKIPEAKDYIKRVIGLPGEQVEVVPQRLLVDGPTMRKTLMRITHDSASRIREESFRPEGPGGFTFALAGGSVSLDRGAATLRSGHESPLQVRTYGPGDVIEVEPDHVSLNGERLLEVVFGPIAISEGLTQWGGEEGLTGRVYSVNSTPRLILVEGRQLSLDPAHVLIDGNRLPEPYLAEEPGYAMPPVRLSPDQYFLMGDNRNRSFDSHNWGPLPADRISGRAEVVFWPLQRCRFLHGW
jgi:signal peptidase I